MWIASDQNKQLSRSVATGAATSHLPRTARNQSGPGVRIAGRFSRLVGVLDRRVVSQARPGRGRGKAGEGPRRPSSRQCPRCGSSCPVRRGCPRSSVRVPRWAGPGLVVGQAAVVDGSRIRQSRVLLWRVRRRATRRCGHRGGRGGDPDRGSSGLYGRDGPGWSTQVGAVALAATAIAVIATARPCLGLHWPLTGDRVVTGRGLISVGGACHSADPHRARS